jgi:hypothetical protein
MTGGARYEALARLISVVGASDYRAARTWSPAQCLD